MRLLGRPLDGDPAITSGESGAVGTGALWEIMADAQAREALALDERSRVLLISTEGATDPVNYLRVMEEA